MLKLKDIYPNVKTVRSEPNDYIPIDIYFGDGDPRLVCYWSTSGSSESLIEIKLDETTGLIFKITVVLAKNIHYKDMLDVFTNVKQVTGLPLFVTDPWKPKPNPLGYHVEFYDPVYYVREEDDFDIYAGRRNVTIKFSSNTVVLHVTNPPVIFGFDSDSNLCYINIKGMTLNEEGFLEVLH